MLNEKNINNLNLIEGEVWSKEDKTIKIIKCYYDEEIVEIKLSSSLTTREYSMLQIKAYIISENFELTLKK